MDSSDRLARPEASVGPHRRILVGERGFPVTPAVFAAGKAERQLGRPSP